MTMLWKEMHFSWNYAFKMAVHVKFLIFFGRMGVGVGVKFCN